ncbi:MAG: FAD-dependent oxidoreductase [Candidatus Eremiobacteraeota bacterium]|nr:FAD-dependent oxidoreductase [Candidatus Eremiobacteraeota bacterium]MBC5827143.1 FAD-dependent oxidoreductase [Candidatus Eremiobacteraeota bacterium]
MHRRSGRPSVLLSRKHAIVIGAGIGGLTAAAILSSRGYDITVLEKTDWPGGRAAQATWERHTFDLGPTLLFMLAFVVPWLLLPFAWRPAIVGSAASLTALCWLKLKCRHHCSERLRFRWAV